MSGKCLGLKGLMTVSYRMTVILMRRVLFLLKNNLPNGPASLDLLNQKSNALRDMRRSEPQRKLRGMHICCFVITEPCSSSSFPLYCLIFSKLRGIDHTYSVPFFSLESIWEVLYYLKLVAPHNIDQK